MITGKQNNVLGGDSLRKQKKKRQKILITDILFDYAKNSTLHGLRYVAEKDLTTVEKLFWIVVFTSSVVVCSVFIRNVYVKWRTSPVIVTGSDRLISVGEIPFPSVTICPQIQNKGTIEYFLKKIEEDDEFEIREQDKLSDLSLLCGGLFGKLGYKLPLFSHLYTRLYTNESVIVNIDSVAPKLYDYFILCRTHKSIVYGKCDKWFKKVYTAEGLCYNMNGLAADEMFRDSVQSNYKYSERDEPTRGWSLENGYTGKEENPFPLQGSENGAIPDLEVYVIKPNEKHSYRNFQNILKPSGVKVYLQHPADHPQSSLYYYSAAYGYVSSMAISADVVSSASSLKEYPAETRQCFFQNDRELRYFKVYTASNCRAECVSNYTLKECGCVGFYMPHDNSSKICAERKLDCMAKAQNALAKTEQQIKIDKDGERCHCLAACNSVEYHADIIKIDLNDKYDEAAFNWYTPESNFWSETGKLGKIEMYFKKPQFVSMRRSELFGLNLTEFFANIGGLLGVFLGFSFLSLLELFYFITLRLFCIFKSDLKEEKVKLNTLSIANDIVEPITVIDITE